MAIVPSIGRVAIAQAVIDQGMMLAIGSGDGAWTTPPAESSDATALLAEIGRRKPVSVEYLMPNETGAIDVAGVGRFDITLTATRYVWITTRLDYEDAATETVRELAVFVGGIPDPALPLGQMYFTPDQMFYDGTMLHLDNIVPIVRNPGTRETFQTLIVF